MVGQGVTVLVCTRGAAFEMNWWKFGVFQKILQYYTQFSPRLHACTDIVNSKELECDITTTAMVKAILRLKTLAFIPS